MTYKILSEIRTKKGDIIPAGAECIVYVYKDKPRIAEIEYNDVRCFTYSVRLHRYFEGFEPFNDDVLETALCDGTCLSLTGCTVEPDGWDPEGFPSMLLAAGLM